VSCNDGCFSRHRFLPFIQWFFKRLYLMLLQFTHTFEGRNPFKRAFVCFAKGPMIIELLCVPLCYWSGAIRLMQDSRGGVTRTDKSLVSILHTREKQAWKDWTNGTDWFLLCLSLFSAGQGDRTFCVPWDLVIRSGLLSSRVLLVKHHGAF
jgi:hypothetical protein